METTRTYAETEILLQGFEEPLDSPIIALAQQNVVQVTLSGPGLVLTILAIIGCIQILHPSLTCTLIAIAPIPLVIYHDFENFISLGPGGTPSTVFGYLKIVCLRMFALSNPYTPQEPSIDIFPKLGYYQQAASRLPQRRGPRPCVVGIAPQRQLDQHGCRRMYQRLRKSLIDASVEHPDFLRTATSCFEKKGLALFAQDPINQTCKGEICHVHDSDHSLHMNLHPKDAKIVLEMGWGERHPLSRGGWMRAFVPPEFLMVYAPRDEDELAVVYRIIEAAEFWVSGKSIAMAATNDALGVVKN